MTREFKFTPNTLRAAFALASLLVSVLVVGAMAGLADHYHADLLASARTAILAQR